MTFWQKLRGSLRIWRAERAALAADVHMSDEWVGYSRSRWFENH